MTEPIAYLNGSLITTSQAAVPVSDAGFVLGVTVAEQLRTFNGKLFRLDEHLVRLERSLAIVGVDPGHSQAELADIAQRLVEHNHKLLSPGDDLGLTMFVTPGPYPTMVADPAAIGPTVCLHTFPVPFRLWASKYREGEALCTTAVEQVSTRSWPAELKCRSRMHYFLADRQARTTYPGARAVMLDEDGMVTESTTANVLIYRQDEGIVTPPAAKILPGISLAVLKELAQKMGIRFRERNLAPHDLAAADEVLLCSTSPCVLPVTKFNGQPIGAGVPGKVHGQLLAAWSQLVGLDIGAQAQRFMTR
jgi:branched-chain amino acid aminotransferase